MRYTEMFRNEPDVLTVPEAAKLLRIGKNQAYELVKNGSLGAIRLGKKIIIPKPALVDFCRNEVKGMDFSGEVWYCCRDESHDKERFGN